MRSTRALVLGLAGGAAALAVATGLLLTRESRTEVEPRSGAVSSHDHALRACERFDDALSQIRENGSAEAVIAALTEAEREARIAVRGDAAFAQLASSLVLLRTRLESDDTRDVAAATDLASTACERARMPQPPPSDLD